MRLKQKKKYFLATLSAFLILGLQTPLLTVYGNEVDTTPSEFAYILPEAHSVQRLVSNTFVFAASSLNVRIGSFNAGQQVTILGNVTNNRVRVRGWYRTHDIIGYIYISALGWRPN